MKAKLIVVMAASFMLLACSSAPMQSYRPAGDNQQSWQIDGDFNPLNGREIKIRFDGQEVLRGSLGILSGSAELKGKYKDKDVSATCSQTMSAASALLLASPKTQCIVFVGNERATTLQF